MASRLAIIIAIVSSCCRGIPAETPSLNATGSGKPVSSQAGTLNSTSVAVATTTEEESTVLASSGSSNQCCCYLRAGANSGGACAYLFHNNENSCRSECERDYWDTSARQVTTSNGQVAYECTCKLKDTSGTVRWSAVIAPFGETYRYTSPAGCFHSCLFYEYFRSEAIGRRRLSAEAAAEGEAGSLLI